MKYVTQLPTHTPQFAFFCNLPQYVNESYARFLENKLRERFDFIGAPVNIYSGEVTLLSNFSSNKGLYWLHSITDSM
ncbi:MAG: hypothetical protein IPN88_18540 [Bacteroidetes bacterium]|nr:hypothetical protein [Bacteroidota bacterium]